MYHLGQADVPVPRALSPLSSSRGGDPSEAGLCLVSGGTDRAWSPDTESLDPGRKRGEVMTQPRNTGSAERGAIFGFVGRARAAPTLARALDRLGGEAAGRVEVLIPNSSGCHAIEGTSRRCHDWLVEAPADGGVGVLCVAPAGSSHLGAREHVARRGHLAIVALGWPVAGPMVTPPSGDDRSAAGLLAERLEDRWIPPLQLSVSRALTGLNGAFHLVALTVHEPGRMVCAARGTGLCLGVCEDGVIVGSEPSAVLSETGRVAFLHGGEIGVLDSDGWDVLAGDALARVRRPIEDLNEYRAWAGWRTLPRASHFGPAVTPRGSSDARRWVRAGQ